MFLKFHIKGTMYKVWGLGLAMSRRYRSVLAKLCADGKLFVHKDYTGSLPLCCYSTEFKEGSSHDLYECFDRVQSA
jgi:hypothetical protein